MKKHIRPQGLSAPPFYTPVVETSGGRLIFIAGQVAWDADGNTVAPGDLAGQLAQAFENVKIALAAVGGTLADVTKLTIYVVNYTPDMRETVAAALTQYVGTDAPPANTLLGVQSLARPDLLVEIDAIAVIHEA